MTGWSGCSDVVLALLPWNILFHMRKTLDVKERLGIAIAMSMGLVYEMIPLVQHPIAAKQLIQCVVYSAGVASFVKLAMLPKLTGDPSTQINLYSSSSLFFSPSPFPLRPSASPAPLRRSDMSLLADTVAVTIWGSAEGALTIIAASIPVLRALIRGMKGHSTVRFDTENEQRLNSTSFVTLYTEKKGGTGRDDIYVYGA